MEKIKIGGSSEWYSIVTIKLGWRFLQSKYGEQRLKKNKKGLASLSTSFFNGIKK